MKPTTSRRPARLRLAALAASALALLLAACGTGGGSRDEAGATERDGGGAFPVTMRQEPAPVTIERRPVRVVALDFPSADAAIALGVVPVGMAEISYVDGGVQAWTKAALGGAEPELFPVDDGYPFETIAALDPDVILATAAYPPVGEHWDTLNAIAPVVANVEAPFVDTWQQGVTLVGRALGRAERAAQVIAEVEAAVADARRANPAFEAKTVSFFNHAGGELHVINRDDDVSIKFLTDLGFAGITDTVAGLPGSEGRAPVSPERYDLLEADLVVGTSPDGGLAGLQAHATFSRVPAVARGAFVPLDIGAATAIAFPSALSLPYALDALVPKLAAALARP